MIQQLEVFLQPIQDAHILRLIERLGEHYQINIFNRFIRQALLQLPLDKTTWDLIEALTEKSDQVSYQGAHLDELYRQIAAAARFVVAARRDLAPSLKNRLGYSSGGSDRVLRDMAINNFSSNLRVFAELLNELYMGLVEFDNAAAKGKKPLYQQIPELNDISKTLIG
jgi:hypothetical protein